MILPTPITAAASPSPCDFAKDFQSRRATNRSAATAGGRKATAISLSGIKAPKMIPSSKRDSCCAKKYIAARNKA